MSSQSLPLLPFPFRSFPSCDWEEAGAGDLDHQPLSLSQLLSWELYWESELVEPRGPYLVLTPPTGGRIKGDQGAKG